MVAQKPAVSPMLAIVESFERGERSAAFLFLCLECGLFGVGCSVVVALFVAPLASAMSTALVGLISACLTGIALTMRGMHKDALKNAEIWAGFRKAYQDPNLDQATAKNMNEIVFDRMRSGRRDDQKSRASSRKSADTSGSI